MPVNSQTGLTLLELLIASALSSILILTLWQLFATGLRSYQWVNGQFPSAFETMLIESMLSDSIRHAGFTPCLPLDRLVSADNKGMALSAYVLNDNQLTLNHMGNDYQSVKLLSHNQIQVAKLSEVPRYLLSDCYHAELVEAKQISHTHEGELIDLAPLQFTYLPPVFLGEWLSETYAVRNQKGLVYHSHHSDVLSKEIRYMRINVEERGGRTFFNVQLQTLLGELITFIVARRMA